MGRREEGRQEKKEKKIATHSRENISDKEKSSSSTAAARSREGGRKYPLIVPGELLPVQNGQNEQNERVDNIVLFQMYVLCALYCS